MQNSNNISLFQFFDNEPTQYAKQTVISLFRTLVETMLDSRSDALVIFKLQDFPELDGVLNRLSYSNSQVFKFNKSLNDKFIEVSHKLKGSENFLLIYAYRFSVVLVFDESSADGFYDANVSLNAAIIRELYDYLKEVSDFKLVDKLLNEMQLDRRGNLIFDIILNKLMSKVEDSQRELLCADSHHTSDGSDIKKVLKEYSHELRNSLGVLGVYSKLIDSCVNKIKDKGVTEQIMQTLTNSSNAIMNSISSFEVVLMDMSNYVPELNLDLKDESINDIVSHTVNYIAASFEERNIKVDVKANEQVTSKIDKHKFSQVLLNLLKNAFEASFEDSEIHIYIDKNDENLVIDVKDFGKGIEPLSQDKIFRQYFTTKDEGSGIGLFLSKEIIKAHGGSLYLHESSENGSTFRIELPLEKGDK